MNTQIQSPKKKILLIDDDLYIRRIYENKLKEEGFEVVVAGDGQEGWETIQSGVLPELIFTGIMMPRMTGFELVEKLQADEKLSKIPVALCSHRNRPEDRETAKKLGVDLFIAQGVTPLVEIIRKIKLLFGMKVSYLIPLNRQDEKTEELIRLLSSQEGKDCPPHKKEIFLEIEPQEEINNFKIKLIC